jgi:hypothetical protein
VSDQPISPRGLPDLKETIAGETPVPVQKPVPPQLLRLRRQWFGLMQLWRSIHYCLGLLGVVCATAVAARPSFLLPYPTALEITAWFSALFIGLLTVFRPHSRANSYADAWRALNDACNRYALEADFNEKLLLRAVRRGEQLIRSSDPTG